MREKKHYNKGREIALTFPVPTEEIEQKKLNKELEEVIATSKKQNKKQAELIKQLEDKLKKDK